MVELGVNMKSFCNTYSQFYQSEHLGSAFRLIRVKSLISSINFSMAVPNTKNQTLEFQAITQNDLKKSLGVCSWKVGHTYEKSTSL
jgi:hypothetical protein